MISNERPSPNGQSWHNERARYYHKHTHPNEETLKVEKIQIERKSFIVTLKENPRGRFVRITEDVGGRRDMVIIPVTGLEDFSRILVEMAKAAREIPSKVSPSTQDEKQQAQPQQTDVRPSEQQQGQ
ncbi:MAG: RNA-binding protein [Verrucomicrobiia bacterium]